MTNSDESEEELHDIDWSETDPFFDYTDPFALSPQISAVIENDVERLNLLLKTGKSVNINDNNGNTPLHLAVLKDKVKVFDFLLTVEEVRIDAVNFDGATPLILALICVNGYCALELIKRGADVNLARNTGYTPLHYAVGNTPEVGRVLIEKGAEINARSCLGETPLYVACERGNTELICMLLYHNADATIPCSEGILPFDVALSKCNHKVQEVLFNYTFDRDKVPVSLYTIEAAMTTNSPLFPKIIEQTSEVLYDMNDLTHLNRSLPQISPEVFRVFLEKFEHVAKDMFHVCNSLSNYVSFLGTCITDKPNFVDFFYTLCDSSAICEIVQNYDPKVLLIHSIIARNLSEDTLTKLVCCLLSYGINIISDDLNFVYKHYGFCELFKIMLHMHIVDANVHTPRELEIFLMPILIYDVNLDIDTYLVSPENYIFTHNLNTILKFFALPRLTEFCRKLFGNPKTYDHIPTVPSLVELSRNVARKHIVARYNINNNVQFFTILNWLPINRVYKAILSYEKELYAE